MNCGTHWLIHAGFERHGCSNLDVRLTFRSARSSGLVEICNENTWSIACSSAFKENETQVICRQLGFNANFTNYFTEIVASNIESDMETSDVRDVVIPRFNKFADCSGSEKTLAECQTIQGQDSDLHNRRGLNDNLDLSCIHQAAVQCGGNNITI